ncbi:DUF7133 domain-containing protein [Fulvivirga sedimenti]|uniref:PQQ-dependent sugar dehydrogenase n=1 Tax=Fulvivirga sedimenti TaxID=2879465 RepID=A0A9X1HYH8_9BACT|nr:c-type cytochrome [Fulvivirga sedimenti]MCA6078907.1 PQQ-dependent sugar dehydrogenase [Fulvivirga sedimenti]
MNYFASNRRIMLFCALLISACSNPPEQENATFSEASLRPLIDPDVHVFEKYAVVKLNLVGDVTIWNPVQIVRGPENVMYVSNNTGEIYSIRDTDNDGLEDQAFLFCDVSEDGLRAPASMTFRDNALYVGASDQIRVYLDQDKDGRADSSYVYFSDIPYSEHPYEWTSGLTFEENGDLYFVLTTDSWNASPAKDPDGLRGSLLRFDGSELEQYATGLRSVPSMSFDASGKLFFIDNEGGGNPTEELNIAVQNAYYGHNPEKYKNHPDKVDPVIDLTYDVAPSGIEFATPDETGQDLFISYYGPGERWKRGSIGKVRVTRDADGNYTFEERPLVTDLPKLSDLALGEDGSIYVTQVGQTDYWYQALDQPDGAIYRLIPAEWVETEVYDPQRIAQEDADESVLALGEKLFTDRVCFACHATDGKTELLGPNLKDIARVYNREELLEEILYPNKRIKPSMAPTRLVLSNGDVLVGRVVNADENQLKIMVVGNKILDVSREDIAEEKVVMQSLMYEGLLNDATEEERNALLDYLLSLSNSNN